MIRTNITITERKFIIKFNTKVIDQTFLKILLFYSIKMDNNHDSICEISENKEYKIKNITINIKYKIKNIKHC